MKVKGHKDPRWAKIVVVFGAVLTILSGAVLITVQSFISKVEDSFQTQDLLGDSEAVGTKGKIPDGPLNILMLGLDTRPEKSQANSRADTIIILHIPATRDAAYLLSVPRDLKVDVKPFAKSKYGGGRAKLTETFFFGAQNGAGVAGGMELLAGTIKERLAITFQAAAIINFESFQKIVEQLGGVNLCIDQDVTSIHIYVDGKGNPHNIESEPNPAQFGRPATYKKGVCRRFKPWEALDYSRQRYGLKNGDYDRQRHQLQLMKAIVKEATSAGVATNPGKLSSIIAAAGQAFIIDTRGVPVPDFVFALSGLAGSDLISLKTNAGEVTSTQIDGISYETLTPESDQMYAAVKNDTLGQFVAANPKFLTTG